MSEWQPIETAPKDGTEVLVFYDFGSVSIVHIAWYRSKEEWEVAGRYLSFDSLEEWEGWWSYTRSCISQEKLERFRAPTHWMPYEAPVTKDQS